MAISLWCQGRAPRIRLAASSGAIAVVKLQCQRGDETVMTMVTLARAGSGSVVRAARSQAQIAAFTVLLAFAQPWRVSRAARLPARMKFPRTMHGACSTVSHINLGRWWGEGRGKVGGKVRAR